MTIPHYLIKLKIEQNYSSSIYKSQTQKDFILIKRYML